MYIMETIVFNVMSLEWAYFSIFIFSQIPVIELLHSNQLHIAFNDQVVEGFL